MGSPSLKVSGSEAKPDLSSLVASAQRGDTEAFTALVDATKDRLYRFFHYLTNQRQLAEDLTQDTYVQAYERLKKLRDPASFSSWLLKIGKNLFLAHVRLHKNSKAILTDRLPEQVDESSGARSPDLSLDIRRALAGLSEDDRWVVLLVDYQEYSYTETSEIMGLSEAAVRSRLHRARKLFLEKFQKS